MDDNDLTERLKTTKNRCEIAFILIEHNCERLLPTILEDLYYGVQCILDIYCIKQDFKVD